MRKPGRKKKDGEERLRRHPRREDWRHAECVYVDLKVGLQRKEEGEAVGKVAKGLCCFFAQAQARLSLTDDSAQTGILVVLSVVYHDELLVLAYPAAENMPNKSLQSLTENTPGLSKLSGRHKCRGLTDYLP